MDLRERIAHSRMSPYQWVIIGLCTFLNALDGYDVLAISFTSTSVAAEFELTGTALGFVMSSALFGMAVGALVLGPVADRIGRRNMTIIAIVVNAIGLFLSTTSSSAGELGAWRLVTGLGIGGILVGTNVLSAEFASLRRRGLSVAIYAAGYGIGASLGGTMMVSLISEFGWRSVYFTGGIFTVIALVLVLVLLPESPDYLYARRPKGAEKRLQSIARRLGHREHVSLQGANIRDAAGTDDESGILKLFSPKNRRVTIIIWVSFFVIMFGFYFVSSWTPSMMHSAGLSEDMSMFVTVALTAGGAVGALSFGFFTARWSARNVLTWFTVLGAVLMAVFVFSSQWVPAVLVVGILVGLFLNGCIAGLYVINPQSYSTSLRSTGAGWAIGIGRFGAIIAPTLAGMMLDGGWTEQVIYIVMGMVVLIAAVALQLMRGLNISANRTPRDMEHSV